MKSSGMDSHIERMHLLHSEIIGRSIKGLFYLDLSLDKEYLDRDILVQLDNEIWFNLNSPITRIHGKLHIPIAKASAGIHDALKEHPSGEADIPLILGSRISSIVSSELIVSFGVLLENHNVLSLGAALYRVVYSLFPANDYDDLVHEILPN